MAKRNLSKKPKRKQLSRKMKRKTLNRKRGGGPFIKPRRGEPLIRSRRGEPLIRSRRGEPSVGPIFGLIILFIFLIHVLRRRGNQGGNRQAGGVSESDEFATLYSCVNDENKKDFEEFLNNVDIKDGILTIRGLTAEEIDEIKADDLLGKYIKVDNTEISVDMKEIPQTQEVEPFIKKISDLNSDNSVVDVECIRKMVPN